MNIIIIIPHPYKLRMSSAPNMSLFICPCYVNNKQLENLSTATPVHLSELITTCEKTAEAFSILARILECRWINLLNAWEHDINCKNEETCRVIPAMDWLTHFSYIAKTYANRYNWSDNVSLWCPEIVVNLSIIAHPSDCRYPHIYLFITFIWCF